mmetsp:Transcript_26699/g.49894  ORF Transcript_26699/g.49894 Transcript_26699/m.49894 type:complete len:96 (-) Transcript_26699:1165-1452(-)
MHGRYYVCMRVRTLASLLDQGTPGSSGSRHSITSSGSMCNSLAVHVHPHMINATSPTKQGAKVTAKFQPSETRRRSRTWKMMRGITTHNNENAYK